MRIERVGAVVLWALACSTIGGACAGAGPKVEEPSDPAVAGVNGTLLQRVQMEPDHKIEFFDLGEGNLAARETMDEGSGAEILPTIPKFATLSDIFKRVAPGFAVPASLTRADADSAHLRESKKNVQSPPPPSGSPDALSMQRSTSGHVVAGVETQKGALLSCSKDAFNDNFGEKWFMDNICTPLTTPIKECHTNWGFYNLNVHGNSGISTRQFEGDFKEPGHFAASFYSCGWSLFEGTVCFWLQKIDVPVAPRRVESWFLPASNKWWNVRGESPCGHLGVAIGHD